MPHIPSAQTPASVQQAMGAELVEACETILAKYGLTAPQHSVPLLAAVLYGQATRYGWTVATLAQYCLKAFSVMHEQRATQTTQVRRGDT
jgi:hypothetical protein